MEAEKEVEGLIKTLKRDRDSEARAKAVEALGEKGGEKAVESLIQALREDSNSYVRLRAALALEAVKDAAAVEPSFDLCARTKTPMFEEEPRGCSENWETREPSNP